MYRAAAQLPENKQIPNKIKEKIAKDSICFFVSDLRLQSCITATKIILSILFLQSPKGLILHCLLFSNMHLWAIIYFCWSHFYLLFPFCKAMCKIVWQKLHHVRGTSVIHQQKRKPFITPALAQIIQYAQAYQEFGTHERASDFGFLCPLSSLARLELAAFSDPSARSSCV
jgi:hypothetical protein